MKRGDTDAILANASISTFLSKQRIALLPVAIGDDADVQQQAKQNARHLLVGTDTVLLKLLVGFLVRVACCWLLLLLRPASAF